MVDMGQEADRVVLVEPTDRTGPGPAWPSEEGSTRLCRYAGWVVVAVAVLVAADGGQDLVGRLVFIVVLGGLGGGLVWAAWGERRAQIVAWAAAQPYEGPSGAPIHSRQRGGFSGR